MGGETTRKYRRSIAKAQGIEWNSWKKKKPKVVEVPAITVQSPKKLTRWQRIKAWWVSWFR